MKVKSLRALYLEQLKDLHRAERQLIKALPAMAKAASSEELRNAFAEHLGTTKKHAHRIETIFWRANGRVQEKKSKSMERPDREGNALSAAAHRFDHYEIADMVAEELRNTLAGDLDETRKHVQRIEAIFEQMSEWARGKKRKAMENLVEDNRDVSKKDAALIAAAQRVEHYGIAGYGCVRTYAMILGDKDSAALLAQTLTEKKEAEETLTGVAAQLNLRVPKKPCQSEKRAVPRLATRAGSPILSQLQY